MLLVDQLRQVWQTSPNFEVYPILAGIHQTAYAATNDFDLDLKRLTNTADGFMDDIHPRRNEVAADLVSLLVETMQYCGISWRPALPLQASDASYGFSVVNRTCGLYSLSFAHELGHNFGMRHDRYVEGLTGGYNFGFVEHAIRARSIMAYDNDCVAKGYSCVRYPTYSSPRPYLKKYALGRPIGQPNAAHNMEILCKSAPVVEQYRSPR